MKHMKSLMEKVRKGQGGFTLIELLIVIVILGIVAAVVALNVGGFLGVGEKQVAMTEKDTIQTAVLAAMADHGAQAVTDDQWLGPVVASGHIDVELIVAGATEIIQLGPANPDITFPVLITGKVDGTWQLDGNGMVTDGKCPGTTGGDSPPSGDYWVFDHDGATVWQKKTV